MFLWAKKKEMFGRWSEVFFLRVLIGDYFVFGKYLSIFFRIDILVGGNLMDVFLVVLEIGENKESIYNFCFLGVVIVFVWNGDRGNVFVVILFGIMGMV